MMSAGTGHDVLEYGPLPMKRGAPRAKAHVFIDLVSEHNFWTGLAVNVSEGGVFVATHHLLPPGSLVSLSLRLPGAKCITALGVVCWTRPYSGEEHTPPGLGVQFTRIDSAASLSLIRDFVTKVRAPFLYEN